MTSKAEQAAKKWIKHVIKSQCDVNYEISFLAGVCWVVEQAVQARELTTSGHGGGRWTVPLSILEALSEDGEDENKSQA